MKKVLLIIALLSLAISSCKKEAQPTPTQIVCCSSPLEYVNVEVYLVDYDSINYGNLNAQGNLMYNGQNNKHFSTSPYAITKSQGVILDTIYLNVFGNHPQILNMNPSDDIPDFDMNVGFFPTMDSIKINSEEKTVMEVWDSNTLLASFDLGSYGFYNQPVDVNIFSFASLHSVSNKACVRR